MEERNLYILAEDEGSNGCVIVAEVYRKAEQEEIKYRQTLAPRGNLTFLF